MDKFRSIFPKSVKASRRAGTKDDDSSRGESIPDASIREEFIRLTRAVEELSILNELAREIGASANSRDIMKKIIDRSLRAVHGEQAVITLLSGEANDPMKTYDRLIVSCVAGEQYHFEQNLLGWMLINRKPLVIHDPRGDVRFKGIKWEESIESLLCVPLMIKSDLKGVLTVYNKRGGEKFSGDDERLLSIIAGQSAQVLENARLYEEEKELLMTREELKLAAKIQMDLLPRENPQITGYDIAGRSIPAQVVGGDYYDFISTMDGQLAICPGDQLVIYSDGVVDAVNSKGEPFGEKRLLASFQKHRHERAVDLIDRTVADIAVHSENCEQLDDITMIVMKRKVD